MGCSDRRHPRNQPGDVFVDTSCIDCGTCSRLAPAVFAHDDATPNAFVQAQPSTPEERLQALRAIVSCPVGAIGTQAPSDLAPALATLPLEIAPGVYDCGFAARSTFGACAWLLVREGGNVLVDTPRACSSIMERIEALGGVAWHFLTHRDDVGEHEAYHERFGCQRVMHVEDACFAVEHPIEGLAPVQLAHDLQIVPVPGHTRGSIALLAGDEYLFTGDHVWGDALGRLACSRCLCWWSWPRQQASLERLRELHFRWVLPGHGYPLQADTVGQMRQEVERLIDRMGV